MSEGQGPEGDELGASEKRARLLGALSDAPTLSLPPRSAACGPAGDSVAGAAVGGGALCRALLPEPVCVLRPVGWCQPSLRCPPGF